MGRHALLSASSSHRWLACPPSARLCENYEDKQYIHEKISQIPMHPTRMSESISIHISEAGFEAMKNDPEYEAWVLNDLRTSRA